MSYISKYLKNHEFEGKFTNLYKDGLLKRCSLFTPMRLHALWEKHMTRVNSWENIDDEENRRVCLRGETPYALSHMYRLRDLKVEGTNPLSNDMVYAALRTIDTAQIDSYMKEHKFRYFRSSRRHPRKVDHKRSLENFIYHALRDFQTSSMTEKEYTKLYQMVEQGDLLGGLYKKIGCHLNDCQKALSTMSDPQDIAYFLATEDPTMSKKEDFLKHLKEKGLTPENMIALYRAQSDIFMVPSDAYDRRAALMAATKRPVE